MVFSNGFPPFHSPESVCDLCATPYTLWIISVPRPSKKTSLLRKVCRERFDTKDKSGNLSRADDLCRIFWGDFRRVAGGPNECKSRGSKNRRKISIRPSRLPCIHFARFELETTRQLEGVVNLSSSDLGDFFLSDLLVGKKKLRINEIPKTQCCGEYKTQECCSVIITGWEFQVFFRNKASHSVRYSPSFEGSQRAFWMGAKIGSNDRHRA